MAVESLSEPTSNDGPLSTSLGAEVIDLAKEERVADLHHHLNRLLHRRIKSARGIAHYGIA